MNRIVSGYAEWVFPEGACVLSSHAWILTPRTERTVSLTNGTSAGHGGTYL